MDSAIKKPAKFGFAGFKSWFKLFFAEREGFEPPDL